MGNGNSNGSRQSFWRTIPGMMTGCAALITAIAGLISALAAIGIIGPAAQSTPIPPPAPTSPPSNTTPFTETPIPTPIPTPAVIDVNGTWIGLNGSDYLIEQTGPQFNIQEIHPNLGVTAQGSGTIDGRTLNLKFQAMDGSTGIGSLLLSANGEELSGTFTNNLTGLTTPAAMLRR